MKLKLQNGNPDIVKKIRSHSYILYLLPSLIVFCTFLIYPMFEGVRLSLYSWDGFTDGRFVGLKNFEYLFADDTFRRSLVNSIQVALAAPAIQTFLGLFIAICVSEVLRGRLVYRILLYFPIILSLVAATIIWTWIYSPYNGLLNNLLAVFSIEPVQWLGNVHTALPSLVAISIWRWVGFTILIFVAGMATINQTYYEAAEIDGAKKHQIYRHITVPLLMPFVTINFVVNIFGYLNFFDIIFITTRGGPAGSTQVLPIYMYLQAFNNNDFGMASAAGVILLSFAIVLVLIYFWIIRRSS